MSTDLGDSKIIAENGGKGKYTLNIHRVAV